MRKFLRSTALAAALAFFMPLPNPVTGLVFDRTAYADPVTGEIPSWISSACCGPSDAHKLRADQIVRINDFNWRAEGYSHDIPNDKVKPSQDANAWVFYATYSNGSQGNVYCAFVPLDF